MAARRIPQEVWQDLRKDKARNHREFGRFFREYYGMLNSIQETKGLSLGKFYVAMGSFLQDAIKPWGGYEISELRDLFLRFAVEFMATYIPR